MDPKTIGLTVAGVVAAGVIAAGGVALANSDTSASTSATTSAASSAATGSSTGSSVTGQPNGTQPNGTQPGGMPPGGGTEVTGDEATRVTAAVTAQDSSAGVDHVMKLADGSYLALTRKDGTPLMYAVSADLATVTVQQAPAAGNGAAPPAMPGQNGSTTTSSTAVN